MANIQILFSIKQDRKIGVIFLVLSYLHSL